MPATHFEFLVEERSMEAFLAAWLPRFLLNTCGFAIHSYGGKDALKKVVAVETPSLIEENRRRHRDL